MHPVAARERLTGWVQGGSLAGATEGLTVTIVCWSEGSTAPPLGGTVAPGHLPRWNVKSNSVALRAWRTIVPRALR